MKAPLVLLGVTGGIAAYKSAELCSLLVKAGFEVQVVMTANAEKLVAPLTFATLSRRAVLDTLWGEHEWRPEHIALSDSAALLIVAPATANFLGKYANGIADDALTTLALAFNGPVLLAPAMNPRMWQAPAVCQNVQTLLARGVAMIGPGCGRVACGADGVGRMAEPSEIFAAAQTACPMPEDA